MSSSRDSTADSMDGFDIDNAQWSDNDRLFSSDNEYDRPTIGKDTVLREADDSRVMSNQALPDLPVAKSTNRWLKLIRDRFGAFMDEIARDAGGTGLSSGDTEGHASLHTLIPQIIFTMDRSILFAIMRGNLPRQQRLKKNKKLRRALYIHKQHGSQTDYRHCIIYAYYLADAKSGQSPTVAQMKAIVSTLKKYVARNVIDPADLILIHTVDSQVSERAGERPTMAEVAAGSRRYLVPEGTNKTPSLRSPSAIEKVISKIEEHIDEVISRPEHNEDDPMPTTLCDFGLTSNADEQTKDHETHHNTNSTLALFDAICKALWPASYLGIQRFVIYCIPALELAPAAEQLPRCISRAYFNAVGEINTHEAAMSANCVNAVSASDPDKCWEWTARNIDVKGNEEYFLARDEAYVAAGDSVRRRIEADSMKRDALHEKLAALCEEASGLDADPELRKMAEAIK